MYINSFYQVKKEAPFMVCAECGLKQIVKFMKQLNNQNNLEKNGLRVQESQTNKISTFQLINCVMNHVVVVS